MGRWISQCYGLHSFLSHDFSWRDNKYLIYPQTGTTHKPKKELYSSLIWWMSLLEWFRRVWVSQDLLHHQKPILAWKWLGKVASLELSAQLSGNFTGEPLISSDHWLLITGEESTDSPKFSELPLSLLEWVFQPGRNSCPVVSQGYSDETWQTRDSHSFLLHHHPCIFSPPQMHRR